MNKSTPPAAAALTAPFAVQAQNQPQAVVVVERRRGRCRVRSGAAAGQDQVGRQEAPLGRDRRAQWQRDADESERRGAGNFDQIKVGDLVTLTMMHAIALERKVANNGIRERVDSENAVVARPGEKPGVMVEKSVRVIANVVAVNGKAQTVTLRGPKRTVELAVKDPPCCRNVKVGDQVEGVYTEAVALTVTTAPKK